MELTKKDRLALQELMNVAASRAADTMARLFGMRVGIQVARVQVLPERHLRAALVETVPSTGSVVEQGFWGGVQGLALLMFPREDAIHLVRQLLNDAAWLTPLPLEDSSVLAEVGNIVLSACVSAVAQQLRVRARFRLPEVRPRLEATQIAARVNSRARERDCHLILLSTRLGIGEQHLDALILLVLMTEPHPLLAALRAAGKS